MAKRKYQKKPKNLDTSDETRIDGIFFAIKETPEGLVKLFIPRNDMPNHSLVLIKLREYQEIAENPKRKSFRTPIPNFENFYLQVKKLIKSRKSAIRYSDITYLLESLGEGDMKYLEPHDFIQRTIDNKKVTIEELVDIIKKRKKFEYELPLDDRVSSKKEIDPRRLVVLDFFTTNINSISDEVYSECSSKFYELPKPEILEKILTIYKEENCLNLIIFEDLKVSLKEAKEIASKKTKKRNQQIIDEDEILGFNIPFLDEEIEDV